VFAKLFNFRPLAFWALFVAITVVLCLVNWWLVLSWIVVLVVGALFKKLNTFSCVAVVLCSVVVLSFYVTNMHYTRQPFLRGPNYVEGIVRNITINDNGRASVTLTNVTKGGESVTGRVRLLVPNISQEVQDNVIQVGNVIRAWSNLHKPWDSTSSFNVNNRIRYQGTALQGNITFIRHSNDARSVVLRHSRNFLGNELMYSMLFGDRSSLDEEVREAFTLTGLAHVLAVSGMHVGLIIGILLWILSLFKTGKKTQFIIILLVLVSYIYLADFRYSIMRASIMFLILLFNRMFLRRVETINSISLAAIIILILFPHSILSLSFQLSFACLVGISLFYRPVYSFLEKKIFTAGPRWLITSVTLYLTTAITTFPLLVGAFGYYPLIGLVANVMLLPLLILAFQLSVIALVTWFGFPLLYLVDWIVWFVIRVSDWLASISWQRLAINQSGFWFLFYFLGIILLSRFIFIKNKALRYSLAAACCFVYVASLLVTNFVLS